VLGIEIKAGEISQRMERGLRAVRELALLRPWPEQWTKGMRQRGGQEQAGFRETATVVEPRRVSSGDVAKEALFMHPPWIGGVGYCFARYDLVLLPAEPPAAFRAVVGKGDGSDLGDGILYRVIVADEAGREKVVAEKTVTRHEWLPLEADLTPWAGRRIALKLVADPGPQDNSSGDWGCWAEMRLESLQPVLHLTLDSNVESCRHEPGPHPLAGLGVEEIRKARAGWLHYDGKGLSGTGAEYGSFAELNGIELGNMAVAGGDEAGGVFQERVSIPLTATALRSLDKRNRFVLRNPNRDCFSVRRFWIELELADGRKCSSDISTATYSQPPDWAHAEGIGVPFGHNIALDIWFPE
jgi:hypothetical protein